MAAASVLAECGRVYVPQFDGMFSVTTSAFEGEAIATWNQWFESMGQVHYPVGPLSIEKTYEEVGNVSDPANAPIIAFLSQMEAKYGKHSVIYVSF
jgi:GH25 family lysozyme M1 (1,4-beta-N-acetylmuramidase)